MSGFLGVRTSLSFIPKSTFSPCPYDFFFYHSHQGGSGIEKKTPGVDFIYYMHNSVL